jgi:hypothetical protein
MAKVSVRRCDRCKGFDSDQVPVRRLHVIALRFDLCINCAIVLVDDLLRDAVRSTELVLTLFGVPAADPAQLDFVYGDAVSADSAHQADRQMEAAAAQAAP